MRKQSKPLRPIPVSVWGESKPQSHINTRCLVHSLSLSSSWIFSRGDENETMKASFIYNSIQFNFICIALFNNTRLSQTSFTKGPGLIPPIYKVI